jgi:SSS family solute:Na+ symporter
VRFATGPLDAIIFCIYFGVVIWLGIHFAKQKSTEEYFLGNRMFRGWVVGLSLLGYSISSLTFLANPGSAFQGDWKLLVPSFGLPFALIIASIVFIPMFRRGKIKITSAYEYLEERYGPWVRLYGAFTFLIMQVVRLGIVLYLVAIPVSFLTGVHIVWVIIIGGVLTSFYVVAGGIEAVIWTDGINYSWGGFSSYVYT